MIKTERQLLEEKILRDDYELRKILMILILVFSLSTSLCHKHQAQKAAHAGLII